MKRPLATGRGMALVITLAFIVMIAILIVGLASSMRTDRPAANSYSQREQASQFAQTGVDNVIGTLSKYASVTSGTGNGNWIVQPGQMIVSDTNSNRLTLAVPLHSGSAGASVSDPFFAPPNLNVPTFRDPGSLLISSGTTPQTMSVGWIYVRKSGTLDRSVQPATTGTDPIVGRYAYWTDDESSKVNYNIAWGRTTANTQPPGSVTKVDLTALPGLTGTLADAMRSAVLGSSTILSGSTQLMGSGTTQQYSFFNTPQDARRVEPMAPGIAKVLQNNKFDLTHYNHDPNTTFFNEPRIVLTTHPNLAGWTNTGSVASPNWVGVNGKTWANGGQPRYLRILKDPEDTNDPGLPYTTSIDTTKLNETIATLALRPASAAVTAGYMQRTDWPMVNGNGSIQSKFYGNYPTTTSASGITARTSRLAQLAVNIIDYVRAKESPKLVITPIIGYFDPTKTDPAQAFAYNQTGAPQNGYIGLTRMPCINELGVWYGQNTGAAFTPQSTGVNSSQTINTGDMYYLFKIEIYLPRNYGIASIDLSTFYLSLGGVNVGATKWVPNYSLTTPPNYNIDIHKIYAGEMDNGSTILTAGSFAVISRAVKSTLKPTDPRPTTTGVGTKFILEGGVLNNNYQLAPANNGLANGIPIDSGSNIGPGAISSLEVDDPRLNAHSDDWLQVQGNSFGKANSRCSLGKSPLGILPEVDTDNGVISDASLYMPPPKGTTYIRADGTIDDNTAGQVMSVGELGYIHTGYEPCSVYTDASGNKTPIPVGVPWRTLRLQPSASDTSVVPDWAFMDLFTAPVAAPAQNNKYVYAPHDTACGGRVNLNSKAEPFGMARTLPLAAVLQNCTYDSTRPTSKLDPSAAQQIANNIYNRTLATSAPAGKQYGYQFGYDSPGEVVEVKGVADTGEKSEELVRQISNLVTTRGNVFSVYTVGQAIKQTPNQKLVVTGEQRLQAMIERYLDPATNQVRFTPIYFRTLNP